MWETVTSAPFLGDLELAVLDEQGQHALVFPCRRTLRGWVNAQTGVRIDVRPTHWRPWQPEASPLASDPVATAQEH